MSCARKTTRTNRALASVTLATFWLAGVAGGWAAESPVGKPPETPAAADEWPQFRGPGGLGVAEGIEIPSAWDTTNHIAWRIDVPGLGWSSPIIWKNRVFLTTAVNSAGTETPEGGFYLGKIRGGKSEHVWLILAYELGTGRKLWEREVFRGVPGSIHLKSSFASATPVTDGKRVYAWFGEIGLLAAVDVEGRLAWTNSVGPLKSREGWGFGASPVLHGGRVYLVHDNEEKSVVAAMDTADGKDIWRVDRDKETNWSTPLVWENENRTELVVAATAGIRSYDLEGRVLWQLKGMTRITTPTPLAQNRLLYVGSGFVADARRPLYAIRAGASGDISLKEGETNSQFVAWCQPKAAPYIPSFLVYKGFLYVLLDRGGLSCYDALTGAAVYENRSVAGPFTASPWGHNGKVFCLAENGSTTVVQAGPEFKVMGQNPLNETCLASPAVSRGHLLIRTATRLYCIVRQ